MGAVAAVALLGSALMTLGVGVAGARADPRLMLLLAAALMAATGLGFAAAGSFALIAAVALLGTINPSAGSVDVFAPVEQALLTHASPDAGRTAVFARYSLVGALAAEARTGRLTGARPPTHPVGQGLVRDRPVRLRPKHRVQTPAPGAGGGDVHAASPHHHGHPTRSPRGTPDVPPRHRRASGGNSARDPLALGGRPGPLQRFRGRGAAVTDGPVRRLVPAPSTASRPPGRA